MKLWLDDVRPAPDGWVWIRSVNEAKNAIINANARFVQSCKNGLPNENFLIERISLDHDAGDYANDGGDYIRLLDWIEWLYDGEGTNIEFHLHSANPVGVQNMRRIIQRNGWKEIM